MEWQPQREAFCASYGTTEPRIRLRDIAHWAATMPQGSSACDISLHDEEAYVAPGYFYMPVSDEPDANQIFAWRREAETAHWLLIPSIPRPKETRWYGHDIIAVPFMQAAYFRVTDSMDSCLRENVGNGQYKDIVRRTRKAERLCRTEFHRLSDLGSRPRLLDDFAELQALNVVKYQHAKNLYSREVLHALARSPAAGKYFLKMNYDQAGEVPLYGSLSYADDQRGVFSQLVQGQDRSSVPAGLNLYISDYYQLYKFADELGFSDHCLGRGAVEAKRRAGANHVLDLVNVTVPVNTGRQESMYRYAGLVAR